MPCYICGKDVLLEDAEAMIFSMHQGKAPIHQLCCNHAKVISDTIENMRRDHDQVYHINIVTGEPREVWMAPAGTPPPSPDFMPELPWLRVEG